ncbi:hypothetical protein, partial [Klebsiella sp. CVUAS 8534.2]
TIKIIALIPLYAKKNAKHENITKTTIPYTLHFLAKKPKNNDSFLKDSGKERKSDRVFAVAMIENTPTAPAKTIAAILSSPVERSLIP